MRWNGEITLLPFDQEVEVSIRMNSCQNGIFESDRGTGRSAGYIKDVPAFVELLKTAQESEVAEAR